MLLQGLILRMGRSMVIDFYKKLVPSGEIASIYFKALVEYCDCCYERTDRKRRRKLKKRFKIASDFVNEFDIPLFKEVKNGR